MKIIQNIKYFIGFVTLIYLGYLFVKNKDNEQKISELTDRVNKVTEKNKRLIKTNNKIIKTMMENIKKNEEVVEDEKDISVSSGTAASNVINAGDKFNDAMKARNKRMAELKSKLDEDHND